MFYNKQLYLYSPVALSQLQQPVVVRSVQQGTHCLFDLSKRNGYVQAIQLNGPGPSQAVHDE